MGGPWEDFQSQSGEPWKDFAPKTSKTASGPWEDFAPQEDRSVPFGSVLRGAASALQGVAVASMETGLDTPESGTSLMRWAEDLKQYAPVPPEQQQAAQEYQQIDNKGFFEGIPDRLAWVARNPGTAATWLGESLGSSAGPLVGAAAGGTVGNVPGAAIGTLIGSTAQGYSETLQEFLRAKKLDPLQEATWKQFYADPEMVAEARAYAAKKGVAQGVFDALTSFIGAKGAGRVITNKIVRSPAENLAAPGLRRTASEFGIDTAIEGAGGAAGYAAGQVATGERVSPNEAFMEFMGELGAGAPMAGLQVSMDRANVGRSSPATLEQILAASQGSTTETQVPETQPIASFEDAEAEGRTWYAIASAEGKVDSLTGKDYNIVERNYANRTTDDPNAYIVAGNADDVTMPASEVSGMIVRDEPLDVRSVNPSIPAEELRTQLLNPPKDIAFDKHYKILTDLGLRITPDKVASFVGDAYQRRIRPAMEAPLDAKVVTFTNKDGTQTIQATNSVDLLKAVKSKEVTVSLTVNKMANSTGLGKLTDFVEVKDPELKTVLDTEGQEGFRRKIEQLIGPTRSQAVLDSLFEMGKLEVKPNAAAFHRYADAHNANSVRIISKTNKINNAEQSLIARWQPMNSSYKDAQQGSLFPSSGITRSFESTVRTPVPLVFNDTILTTYNENIPPEIREMTDAMSVVMRKMNKRLGIERLHIVWTGDLNSTVEGNIFGTTMPINVKETPSGRHVLHANGDHYIIMNWKGLTVKSLTPERQQQYYVQILAHEYGHAISAAMHHKASLETQSMLWASYRRFQQEKNSLTDSDVRTKFARQKVAIPLTRLYTQDPGYYTGYEEYFANQVARWMTTDSLPMGMVAKFYKEVGRKIVAFIREMKEVFGIKYLGAEPEITNYLNSILEGKATAEWGKTVHDIADAESRVENLKAGVASPLQPETTQLFSMMEVVGAAPLNTAMGPVNTTNPALNALTPMALAKSHSDHFNRLYKWGLNFRQLAALNPNNQELQLYVEYIERMQLDTNKVMAAAETRLKAQKALGKHRDRNGVSQAEYLARFVFELDQMTYLTPLEKQQNVRRWPTQQEFTALAQKHNLSPEALVEYQALKQEFFNVLDRAQELAVLEASRVFTDPVQLAKAIQDIVKQTAMQKRAPYFPHIRFGSWAVSVRNANGKLEHFETFESQSQQKQAAKDFLTQFPGMSVVTSTLPEDVAPFQGMPGWFLDKMANMPGMNAVQKEWMEQLRYELAPAQSFRKHSMKRKGVEGYSRDMQRTFAQYMFHHARSYGRLKYQYNLNQMIASARSVQSTAAVPGQLVDVNKQTRIADYMQDHLNEVMNPSRDWSFFRSFIAVLHLGFNVSSAALNLSQVPVMTQSYLGAHFKNDVKVAFRLSQAMTDLKTFYKRGTYANLQGGEMKAMAWLIEENLITESMAAELAALSSGGHMLPAGFATNALQQGWMQISEKAMWMFQQVEQVNRRVTARASYRLAYDDYTNPKVTEQRSLNVLTHQDLLTKGFTDREANALLYAKQTLIETQYDYSKIARPRFMRGKAGLLFTFYNFTQNTVFTLMNPRNKGIMLRYSLIMLALAGGQGLLPDDAEDILNFIGRRLFGKDFNIERETRDFLTDYMSPKNADLAIHGSGRYGFGIPWLMKQAGVDWMPSVDRSQNIALGRVLPLPVTKLLSLDIKPWDKLLTQDATQIAGAGYSFPMNMLQAITNQDADWGDPKRWERMMPTAMKNMTQAWRMWHEQGIRDKSYALALELDTSDPTVRADLIAKALGYNPTRLSQYYDAQNAKYEMQAYWSMSREHLLDRAYRAKFFYKDDAEFKSIIEEIKDFNRSAPDRKLHITAKTLQRSAKMRQQRQQAKQIGADPGISPAIIDQVQKMYPGAVQVKKLPASPQ